MTWPTIVVAGAPKCGTSSLHRWLADHPNVCAPSLKETRFLLDRDSSMLPERSFHSDGVAGYASLFSHCHGYRSILESTPDYLYSATAPSVLASLDPQPSIVFVLRSPGARAYSFFNYAKHTMALLPREISFQRFLEMIRDPDDHRLNDLGTVAHTLRYGNYADYLEQWIRLFSRDRLRFILFESMVAEPQRVVTELASWAGMDSAFYADYAFPVENESYDVRSQRLQRLRMRLAPWLPAGSLKLALRRVYRTTFTTPPDRTSDRDRGLIAALEEEYRPANRRLAVLTGLDLSRWPNGS